MLKKIWRHLKSGTLISALRTRFSPAGIKQRKMLAEWNRVARKSESIIYTYDNAIKLKLYTNNALSRVIFDGSFEEEELTYYKRYIKKGYTILDIGANIGLHALYSAYLTGTSGFVHCFEPVESTYKRLEENLALNNFTNIKSYNLAISDKSGTSTIVTTHAGYDAWNSMAMEFKDQISTKVEQIKTMTLDDFIMTFLKGKKVDFIKIDTEGWELNILLGGCEFLKTNSPVIMIEYAEDILKQFNRKLEDIYDKLTEYGYKLYKYNHEDDTFRQISRNEKFGVANIIATKEALN